MAEQLRDFLAASTLASGITAGASSLTLNTGDGSLFPATGNFDIRIDSELITVGSRAGDVLSGLTRGVGTPATTAATHTGGAIVRLVPTKRSIEARIADLAFQITNNLSEGTPATMRTNLGLDPLATGIDGLTAKTTPVDADELAEADSAAAFASKKVTFLNAWLNYFKVKADALYQVLGSYITSLTGDVTAAGPGAAAATISAGAVTNAKMANMTAPTYKGRHTAGTGAPEDVSVANLTSDLTFDSLTAKTSLVSGDEFPMADSAASFVAKKVTVATLDARYAQVALAALVADYGTTGALPAGTYINGVAGVGATFTVTATGTVTVDGHVLALGDRLLVKNQASSFQDGLYTVTIAGAIGVALVLTRSIDMDTPSEFNGAFVAVINGTANAGTYWVQTATVASVGVDAQTWTQFIPAIGTNSVTNAMLAQMATDTIKGNNTGGTANAADLTITQTNAMLLDGASLTNGGGSGTAQRAALTGDVTASAGSNATTVAGVAAATKVINEAQGASVAAANNLVLGSDGNFFTITGNTQINLLASTNFQAGSMVTLKFSGTPLIKNNQTVSGANKPILLLGGVDWKIKANDTLTLRYDGTSWNDIRIGLLTQAAIEPEVTDSTTSRTWSAGDVGECISFTSSSAITLTLPQDSDDTGIPIGAVGSFSQDGTGNVTISAGTGATVHIQGGKTKSNEQYGPVFIKKISANTYRVTGDLQ